MRSNYGLLGCWEVSTHGIHHTVRYGCGADVPSD
jgi:hypothetical protein